MTGPPVCSTCRQPWLLWHGMGEPAGPGRVHEQGECYLCSKLAAMANGGLPTAALEQRPGLTQMLALWDRADERQALRLRGIRYVVTLGGQTLELTA